MPPSTTFAPAATASSSSFCAAVALHLVDHRPEADLVGVRVPDGDGACALGERLDVAVVERAGDDVAAGGDAGLALVVAGRPGADHRRVLDVGVVEHDERVVAAELERAVLELAAGRLGDLAAGPRRAGEVHHRDAGMGDEPWPTSTPPGTTCSSPAGRPAAANTSARIRPPVIGVSGDGLSTTALPSASAGASTRMPRISGKFHGVSTPTTPRGMRSATLTRVGSCDGMT